ncbi:MAG: SMC-Scp complex subunit ScpB [Patescibacteria group bacterium]|nr:SMC-Scp complex subunit ScpB [Patescibacteria group bacterium]
MNLKSKIESLLFVSISPLSVSKIAKLVSSDKDKVKQSLQDLKERLKEEQRGIQLMKIQNSWQLSTNPDNSSIVREYLKDEQTGELTRPALETLTIIAYRGPIAKSELDVIRGVNCSLILRNLMIKGLVESYKDKSKMDTFYKVTFEFLKFLGLSETSHLPDYEKLNKDESLEKLLNPESQKESENEEKEKKNEEE